MNISIPDLLNEMFESCSGVNPDDIPNIDLYMDQVTTFMDNNLKTFKRKDDDKVLTKTMINNYAKNDLLPSPEKKKYTKDHIVLMTLIYYFKNVLSINDIKRIMKPITEGHFEKGNGSSMIDIYRLLYNNFKSIASSVSEDVEKKIALTEQIIPSESDEDTTFVNNFMIIAMLTYDITLKKQLIETFIDQITPEDSDLLSDENETEAEKKGSEKGKSEKKAEKASKNEKKAKK